ncbi:MAG TPA: hypothetical protein V6C65_35545 [Allocoleopsis sp.]
MLPANLSNILGTTAKENDLLSFITKYQFDSISLYDLAKILGAGMGAQLSSFIQAAKACGVVEVNAIGSTNSNWVQVQNYQSANAGKFDGLVTEVEFWNQSPVSTAFSAFVTQLQYMQTLGITPPQITPYIGWLNRDPSMSEAQEAAILAANVSRMFVHAYVKDPANAASYIQSRVTALLTAKPSLPIWPIFSAEGTQYKAGSEVFMGDWLAANSLDAAEAKLSGAKGFQYFHHAFLKQYLK